MQILSRRVVKSRLSVTKVSLESCMCVLTPSSALHSHALMFRGVQRAMTKILMDVLGDGPLKHTKLKQKHVLFVSWDWDPLWVGSCFCHMFFQWDLPVPDVN